MRWQYYLQTDSGEFKSELYPSEKSAREELHQHLERLFPGEWEQYNDQQYGLKPKRFGSGVLAFIVECPTGEEAAIQYDTESVMRGLDALKISGGWPIRAKLMLLQHKLEEMLNLAHERDAR